MERDSKSAANPRRAGKAPAPDARPDRARRQSGPRSQPLWKALRDRGSAAFDHDLDRDANRFGRQAAVLELEDHVVARVGAGRGSPVRRNFLLDDAGTASADRRSSCGGQPETHETLSSSRSGSVALNLSASGLRRLTYWLSMRGRSGARLRAALRWARILKGISRTGPR